MDQILNRTHMDEYAPPAGLGRIRTNLQFFADNSDRTEKATPKKREELRKKGQVLQSREVSSNLILLVMFISFKVFGGSMHKGFKSVFQFFVSDAPSYNLQEPAEVMRVVLAAVLETAKIVAPFFIIAIVIGILSSYVQVGFLFSIEPLKPKLSHINPLKGLKRIFSTRSLFEFVKSIAKVALVSIVAWTSIQAEFANIAKLMSLEIGPLTIYILNAAVDVGIKICFALMVITAVDYFFQWRKHEKEIRMTKQEVKEEYKQLEGNPEIRQRIRQKQREVSMRRMMREVPKADVVITNPTHLAVAIKYEPSQRSAPYVVAKGADYMASRIRDVAKENGVEIVENKPLAQTLYHTVDIGESVPPELYKAVAEVLAYVYSLQGRNPLEAR
jgi:flagellar biosynthetic protein FlhB